jgi:hypothetical protein
MMMFDEIIKYIEAEMGMDIRKTMKVVYRTLFIQKMVCDTTGGRAAQRN